MREALLDPHTLDLSSRSAAEGSASSPGTNGAAGLSQQADPFVSLRDDKQEGVLAEVHHAADDHFDKLREECGVRAIYTA